MTDEEIKEEVNKILDFLKFWKTHGWIPAIKMKEVKESRIAIETVLNLIQEQKEEIEKKDKIIDLMAEDIYRYQIECDRYFKDKEEVKQYFEYKVKESQKWTSVYIMLMTLA